MYKLTSSLPALIAWLQVFLLRPTTWGALVALGCLGLFHPAVFASPYVARDLVLFGAMTGSTLALAALASMRSTLEILPASQRRGLELTAVCGAAAAFGLFAGAMASGMPTAALAAACALTSVHLAALAQYLLRAPLGPTSSALALLALTWAAPAVLPAAAARAFDPRPAGPTDMMLAAGILLGGWHLPYASRLRS